MKTVIYHGNCYDGVTAAYICWTKFGYEDVRYIPCNYSDPPLNVKGDDVFIVDFSFKRPILEQMRKDANSLVILDHHKTAQEALQDFPGAIFDMERSGAGITYDFLYPNNNRYIRGSRLDSLVCFIEDRDLWRFQLPNSKEVNAWIQSWDIDLATWIDEVGKHFSEDLANTEGKSLLRIENKYVKQIAANARLKRINEYMAPYVETSILMSEVCDYLIKNYPGNYPFAFYSFHRKDGKIQYGLRSRSDFDVSVIAKGFGGGGHKQAAGFELDQELP